MVSDSLNQLINGYFFFMNSDLNWWSTIFTFVIKDLYLEADIRYLKMLKELQIISLLGKFRWNFIDDFAN